MTENVASLRSVKVATPPCAAKAAIPCGLAVRKQHKMLFAASKFEKRIPKIRPLTCVVCAQSQRSFLSSNSKKEVNHNGKTENS